MVRVLGLDVGSKSIGIAVTDELGFCAHAVTTLERKGTARDVVRVLQYCKQYATTKVVIGMPYEMDGALGKRAVRVQVFADAMAAAGAEVELCDERYSTVEAEAVLLEADLSRKKRRQVIDQLAAQVILERWLIGQRE